MRCSIALALAALIPSIASWEITWYFAADCDPSAGAVTYGHRINAEWTCSTCLRPGEPNDDVGCTWRPDVDTWASCEFPMNPQAKSYKLTQPGTKCRVGHSDVCHGSDMYVWGKKHINECINWPFKSQGDGQIFFQCGPEDADGLPDGMSACF